MPLHYPLGRFRGFRALRPLKPRAQTLKPKSRSNPSTDAGEAREPQDLNYESPKPEIRAVAICQSSDVNRS